MHVINGAPNKLFRKQGLNKSNLPNSLVTQLFENHAELTYLSPWS